MKFVLLLSCVSGCTASVEKVELERRVSLRKAHIGEIQSSIWSDETLAKCHEAGIDLA